jgi:hypothetical protein
LHPMYPEQVVDLKSLANDYYYYYYYYYYWQTVTTFFWIQRLQHIELSVPL